MLALSPRVGMIHEPFSPVTPPGISSAPFDRFFRYVTTENEGPYVAPLERTLRFRYGLRRQLPAIPRSPHELARTAQDLASFTVSRARRARPLLKDPIAVFSSEWLASRFGAQVVVLIRHPAAFASSLKRLGWTHRFEHFLDQPLLLRDHLSSVRGRAPGLRRAGARRRRPVDPALADDLQHGRDLPGAPRRLDVPPPRRPVARARSGLRIALCHARRRARRRHPAVDRRAQRGGESGRAA